MPRTQLGEELRVTLESASGDESIFEKLKAPGASVTVDKNPIPLFSGVRKSFTAREFSTENREIVL